MIQDIIVNNTGYNNYNQACIKIIDKNDKIVFNDKTYNGRVSICLNENEYYKCFVMLNNRSMFLYFKPSNKQIVINNNISCEHIITLYLTDYYYNMPIEKGSIILWQKQ